MVLRPDTQIIPPNDTDTKLITAAFLVIVAAAVIPPPSGDLLP
jgi:hypothetical protein